MDAVMGWDDAEYFSLVSGNFHSKIGYSLNQVQNKVLLYEAVTKILSGSREIAIYIYHRKKRKSRALSFFGPPRLFLAETPYLRTAATLSQYPST
jgi:hypothetical protein